MKAIGVKKFGNISNLTQLEVPQPQPTTGRLIIQTKAFALNPYDLGVIDGSQAKFRPISLPAIPGSDVAGIVIDKDPSITEFNVGDAIVGLASIAGYSEYVSVPYRRATKIPAGLEYTTAAALPNASITAYDIVFGALKDVTFSKALVVGAAGAVGTTLYQILNSLNKKVSIVVSSTDANQFDPNAFEQIAFYDVADSVERLSDYEVIINVAPQNELTNHYLDHLLPSGLLISTTGISNFNPDDSRLIDFNDATYKMNHSALKYLVKNVVNLNITIPIAKILNFNTDEIREVFYALQSHHPRGKYVVQI